MKEAKNRSMTIELRWAVQENGEEVCVSVLLSTKAILGLLVVSTFHHEELHLALMCVFNCQIQTRTNTLAHTFPTYRTITAV